MGAKKTILRPKEARLLELLGNNIKLARLRRKLSTQQVSERANIGRSTLWHLEKGSAQISIGVLLKVLGVLGLDKDLERLAQDDVLGRKLQDARIKSSKRAPSKKRFPDAGN